VRTYPSDEELDSQGRQWTQKSVKKGDRHRGDKRGKRRSSGTPSQRGSASRGINQRPRQIIREMKAGASWGKSGSGEGGERLGGIERKGRERIDVKKETLRTGKKRAAVSGTHITESRTKRIKGDGKKYGKHQKKTKQGEKGGKVVIPEVLSNAALEPDIGENNNRDAEDGYSKANRRFL